MSTNETAAFSDEVQAEVLEGTEPEVTDAEVVDDTADADVETDEEEGGEPETETDAQDAEVVAEEKPAKRQRKSRKQQADEAGSEVAVRDTTPAEPVAEKSAFTPAKARALTEKLIKQTVSAVELFIEAYNGRIWLAYGYESWQQYLDSELGELRPRLPKAQRLEITGKLKTEAKMSQGAIAAALGVDQKTVSNDLRELRGAGEDAAEDRSVGVDGVERSAGDRSARRKPFIERVSAVFDKLDKSFGDLTELIAEEEWEQELGSIANRHRPDVARFLGQLRGLQDTFSTAPEFEG